MHDVGDENYALGFILSRSHLRAPPGARGSASFISVQCHLFRSRLTFLVQCGRRILGEINWNHTAESDYFYLRHTRSLCAKSATTAECLLPSLAESMHLLALQYCCLSTCFHSPQVGSLPALINIYSQSLDSL
jgi:hypothetical protein